MFFEFIKIGLIVEQYLCIFINREELIIEEVIGFYFVFIYRYFYYIYIFVYKDVL